DVERANRRAFPPAGVVVVLRDLVEAELLVVVRTDPFAGVDRALLERRIDVAAGDLLRYHAETLEDQAREAADAELQALHVVHRLDFLAEPAAHLAAGAAEDEGAELVLLVVLVDQLMPAAVIEPGVVFALVHGEGQAGLEHEVRALAEVVVGRRLAGLDG